MNRMTIILCIATAATLSGLMAANGIDEDHSQHEADHKVARAALARGEVLPLEKILKLVRPKVQHEIVGIKFEMHSSVWYYEIRAVDQTGHLHYIHANAVTGSLETVENHQ